MTPDTINTHEQYDVIIIGSGIGGLSCAAILKFMRKKVLVLDCEDVPGGCMQTVSHGPWTWNLGLQYLCPLSTWLGPIYLKELDLIPLFTDPPVEFKDLSLTPPGETTPKRVYQVVTFPEINASYRLYSDMDDMYAYLKSTFPDQTTGIDTFWEYLKNIDMNLAALMAPKFLPPFLAKFLSPFLLKPLKPLMDINFDEAMEKIFPDTDSGRKIRLLLASYWNFTGLPLNTSMLLWSIGINQQLHGIKVPVGGSEKLVEGFIGFIRRKNPPGDQPDEIPGTVSWGSACRVKHVLTKGIVSKTAYGVELADGRKVMGRKIVSAIGLAQTVGNLLPARDFPRYIRKSLKDHISVPSLVSLRIGFPAEITHVRLAELGIDRTAYRMMLENAWNMDDDPTSPDWVPMEVMTLFPKFYATNDDDTTTLQTAELMVLVNYQKFFSKDPSPDSDVYKKAQASMKAKLLSHFKTAFPKLAHLVNDELCFIITPRELDEAINHDAAAIYGLDSYKLMDPAVLPRSGIKNFYLSGMDVFAQGITTSCGVLTAGVILMEEAAGVVIKQGLQILISLPVLILKLFLPRNKRQYLNADVRKILLLPKEKRNP